MASGSPYSPPPPLAIIDKHHPLASGLVVVARPINQAQRICTPGLPYSTLTRLSGGTHLSYSTGRPSFFPDKNTFGGLQSAPSPTNPMRASFYGLVSTPSPSVGAFPVMFDKGVNLTTFIRHTNLLFRVQTRFTTNPRSFEHPSPIATDRFIGLGWSYDRSSDANLPRMMNEGVLANGGLSANGTGTPHDLSNTPYTVGADQVNAGNWQGSIALVLYWERLLSDQELLSVHSDPFQVFWWEGKGPRYFT